MVINNTIKYINNVSVNTNLMIVEGITPLLSYLVCGACSLRFCISYLIQVTQSYTN